MPERASVHAHLGRGTHCSRAFWLTVLVMQSIFERENTRCEVFLARCGWVVLLRLTF